MSDKASSGTESRNFDRLLLCPFCGGKAEVMYAAYIGGGGFGLIVSCTRCWAKTGYYGTEEEAIKAWNTRAERTCEVRRHGRLGGMVSFICFSCSECCYGWHTSEYDKPFSYCPNCGRRVTDGD